MDIKQERDGDVVVVRLSGRLDSSAAPGAEERLSAVVSGEAPRVAVDMSALTYVSSAGLRVLLVAAKTAQTKGGKVVLISPNPAVREVLEASGFDKFIQIQA